jgi:hypothetical protein
MATLVAMDKFFSCHMMKDTNTENGPGKGNEVSPDGEMVRKNAIQRKHNPKYPSFGFTNTDVGEVAEFILKILIADSRNLNKLKRTL